MEVRFYKLEHYLFYKDYETSSITTYTYPSILKDIQLLDWSCRRTRRRRKDIQTCYVYYQSMYTGLPLYRNPLFNK